MALIWNMSCKNAPPLAGDIESMFFDCYHINFQDMQFFSALSL